MLNFVKSEKLLAFTDLLPKKHPDAPTMRERQPAMVVVIII